MNKHGVFALAAQFVPKIMQVRRNTWFLLAVGLVLLFALLAWAAIAMVGWFFAQVQDWSTAVPEATRGALATVERQLEQVVPGAREKVAAGLDEHMRALKPQDRMLREVSGSDFAPVQRYPGLTRTYWHREGSKLAVHYEGSADFAAVLDHYLRGFATLGYAHALQSATPERETHLWDQGEKRFLARIAAKPGGMVAVEIEATLD